MGLHISIERLWFSKCTKPLSRSRVVLRLLQYAALELTHVDLAYRREKTATACYDLFLLAKPSTGALCIYFNELHLF